MQKPLKWLIDRKTGMGKERVAHTIHYNNGDRKDNLFIALHCASLSEGILEGKLRKVLFLIGKSETRPV